MSKDTKSSITEQKPNFTEDIKEDIEEDLDVTLCAKCLKTTCQCNCSNEQDRENEDGVQ